MSGKTVDDMLVFIRDTNAQVREMYPNDDEETYMLNALIAAVVFYSDEWKAQHDETSLTRLDPDNEADAEKPSLSLAHVAGYAPCDAFTLQVLEENMREDADNFDEWRAKFNPTGTIVQDIVFSKDESPQSHPHPTVTKEIAQRGGTFHFAARCDMRHHSIELGGPKKAITTIERWRANGKVKTWKTRPEEFRLPIKYGMRDYSEITHLNGDEFHHEADCPYDFE